MEKVSQKHQDREVLKSSTNMSQNTEPINGPTDEWWWEKAVAAVGIGSRYHRSSLDRIQPRKAILEYLNDFPAEQAKGKGLFIDGPVGTGKTSILAYVAFRLAIKTGYVGIASDPGNSEYWEPKIKSYLRFITATGLFNLFFGWNDKEINMRIITLKAMPILMIDDLGREYRSDFPVSRFEEFIEHRYANEMTTIITSNVPPDTLNRMDEFKRIIDRFRDSKWMKLITITGKSQRK